MHEWIIVELENSVHVIPVEDILGHALNKYCLCWPRITENDDKNGKQIWTHDSFDRREEDEPDYTES